MLMTFVARNGPRRRWIRPCPRKRQVDLLRQAQGRAGERGYRADVGMKHVVIGETGSRCII